MKVCFLCQASSHSSKCDLASTNPQVVGLEGRAGLCDVHDAAHARQAGLDLGGCAAVQGGQQGSLAAQLACTERAPVWAARGGTPRLTWLSTATAVRVRREPAGGLCWQGARRPGTAGFKPVAAPTTSWYVRWRAAGGTPSTNKANQGAHLPMNTQPS